MKRRQSLDFCSPQDRSPVLSPWGRANSRSNSKSSIIQVGTDNVVLVEVGSGEESPGPYITRVQGEPARASLGPVSLPTTRHRDPYTSILATADNNIVQAESILTSLGHNRLRRISGTESDEDPTSLGKAILLHVSSHPHTGSDIETNIRRLERTQAKINAALETFRNVQNLKEGSAVEGGNSGDGENPNEADLLPVAEAAQNGMGEEEHTTATRTSSAEDTRPSRRSSAVRRHSVGDRRRPREPGGSLAERVVASWYQDSGQSSDSGVRTSDVCEEGFFSDSEGGLSPFKNRIRGLLGSFGKGKKKGKKLPHRRQLDTGHMGGVEVARPDISIGQFTELVQGLTSTASVTSEEDGLVCQADNLRRPGAVMLRSRNRVTSQNYSNDTFSSLSTTSGLNVTSNRNSVVSEQSMSSESFDNNSLSDMGNGNSSKPAAHDLTPLQLQDRKIFFIAKEIMTSERVYVDVLRLINIEFRDFFQKAKQDAKGKCILPEQDFAKLFSNLPELMMLNEDLLRDFETRIQNWETQKKIADVIVKKGPYLKLYTVYIRDFSSMNLHLDECCQKHPKFGKLVKEFEKQPKCGHLKLQHFLLKPVQRLPQYRLLLDDYLRHLHPDSQDFDDTTNALRIVSEAADHANDTVKQGVSATKNRCDIVAVHIFSFFLLHLIFRTSSSGCLCCRRASVTGSW